MVVFLAGVGTYISMFWDSMGSAMRIFVTLGVGYGVLVVLVSFLHGDKYPKAIAPLTVVAVIMMVGGWLVLVDELIPATNEWRYVALFVSGVMGIQMATLFAKYRRTLFAAFSLFFAYSFMQVGLDILGMAYEHIAIVLGASLFLVGTALEKTPQRVLAELALFIGAFWLHAGLFDVIADAVAAN